MIKYWKARSTALVTALLLTGLSGGINSINLDRAIAQTTSRTIRSQDIEKLRRSGQRWIEIRLRSQRLLAWQGNQLVYAVVVSTGKSATPTPTGLFNVQSKYPTGRMQGLSLIHI